MTPLSIVVIAFMLALVMMSFAFAGGAVPVAIPLAAIVIGVVAVGNFRRRRAAAQTMAAHRDRAKTQKVEFTGRDRETLYTND